MARAFSTDYHAPGWLPGGHAQTIWPVLIKAAPPPLVRERWDTPDGDFLDVDRLPGPADAPLVILFHGLEGSARSHYAASLLHALAARRWQGAVVHFRGCGGEANRLPRAYHSGDADEIDWLLRRFAEVHPRIPRYAAGVSLGGNALLKWLGTREDSAAGLLRAAAAVSAPVDLAGAGHALGRGFNRIYTRHFLVTLKPSALERLQRHPGLYDAARLRAARNLHDFDDLVTAPLHGFRNVADYWERASSRPHLGGIRVPTLLLNALNDPFLPARFLPGPAEVSSHVQRCFPAQGGHVGFVSGSFPGRLDWLPQKLLQFFDQT